MDLYKVYLNVHLLIWTLILLGIIAILRYHWNRRYLYYYASKIPGPFSLPFIGNGLLFLREKDSLKTTLNILETYSPVSKFWLGPHLYIIISRPQDVQVILTSCLEKANCYDTFGRQFAESLLGLPLPVWKEHRKLVNPTFNKKFIDSFHGIFEKDAKKLVAMLDGLSGTEQDDLFEKIWNFTLASAHEALLGVDRVNTKSIKNIISWIIRLEQISHERLYNFWFYSNYIWKRSALYKEEKMLVSKADNYFMKIIDQRLELNVDKDNNEDIVKNGHFLNEMIKALDANAQMSREDIIPEVAFMIGAASETSAITITSVILALGMYLEIQEKTYREIISVIENDEEVTLENTNKLEYTERVIKETLRLAPTVPFIARFVDKDINLGDCVLPAGSNAAITIKQIHRNPDFWPDPLKFDPDRFLPEETKKRHPCAFIPFSLGSRNCIGMKFGMVQMKCIVAQVVRNFKIKTLNYKELVDLETEYNIIAPPINYNVLIEKREI